MKIRTLIILLHCSFFSYTQNEAATLYFGKTLLDFRQVPPAVLSTQAIDPRECAASICDADGNLLFYSNGGVSPTAPVFQGGVFGIDNQQLLNGNLVDSGGCLSSFQGAIILPDPEGITPTNRKYYLFTKDCVESSFSTIHYNSGLTYAIVDMNANNGNGAVISKYNVVVPYHVIQAHKTNYEPVTAVLDSDGEQKSGGAGYWLFSYTDDSLYHIHFGTDGFNQFQKLVGGEGALVVAPDRTHMTVGNELYHLDPVLGTVQHQATLATNAVVAFSSDGSKLYVISGTSLKQYDVSQENIGPTEQLIATVPAGSTLFLAPSKHILIYQLTTNFIDAQIICTNNSGMTCGWDPTNISLQAGTTPYSGRPNIPAHYLYSETSNCAVALEENSLTFLSLYPNPANTMLFVNGLEAETDYVIYSNLGQTVLQGATGNQNPVDLRSLESGTYFIRIQNQFLPLIKSN